MKEITPKELQKLNNKSIKAEKKIFRRRLREIAAGGRNEADFDKGHFLHEDEIITWLRSLGFKVTAGTCKYYITWPEEEDALEKLRKEVNDIWARRIPVNFTWGVRLERFEEEREWIYHSVQHDYVCSGCGKHAEYTTLYCPNCGKKMKPIEGRNYDKE
jgi:predicted transcriptional regulator